MWLWWLYGAIVLVLVVPIVLALAVRIVRTALEIARYADEIDGDLGSLAEGLLPAGELAHTAELATQLRDGTTRYAAALGPSRQET